MVSISKIEQGGKTGDSSLSLFGSHFFSFSLPRVIKFHMSSHLHISFVFPSKCQTIFGLYVVETNFNLLYASEPAQLSLAMISSTSLQFHTEHWQSTKLSQCGKLAGNCLNCPTNTTIAEKKRSVNNDARANGGKETKGTT